MLPIVTVIVKDGFADALRFMHLVKATDSFEDLPYQAERTASYPKLSRGRDVRAVELLYAPSCGRVEARWAIG